MVNPEKLIEGNVYFLVEYFDNKLSIPDIETYIYIGKNVLSTDAASDEENWYFQDPESYLQKGPFVRSKDRTGIDILRADEVTLETMHDLNGMIVALSEITGKPEQGVKS